MRDFKCMHWMACYLLLGFTGVNVMMWLQRKGVRIDSKTEKSTFDSYKIKTQKQRNQVMNLDYLRNSVSHLGSAEG